MTNFCIKPIEHNREHCNDVGYVVPRAQHNIVRAQRSLTIRTVDIEVWVPVHVAVVNRVWDHLYEAQ